VFEWWTGDENHLLVKVHKKASEKLACIYELFAYLYWKNLFVMLLYK